MGDVLNSLIAVAVVLGWVISSFWHYRHYSKRFYYFIIAVSFNVIVAVVVVSSC